MSKKAKGINAERELVHMFWKKDWACIRVAGSGSIKYPSPDILAGNSVRKIVIESKITKNKFKHFNLKEIEELKEFANIFGAEPWLAIKFENKNWYFLNPEDLKETRGLNYSINSDNIRIKGLLFEELVEI